MAIQFTPGQLGMAVPFNEISGLNDTNMNLWLTDFVTLGVDFVRIDIYWNLAKPTSGSAYTWTAISRVVDAIIAKGMKPIGLINGLPNWVSSTMATQATRDAFTDFCTAVATQYNGKISVWELFNEVNMTLTTPANYTEMLKVGYTAIKAVQENSTVITQGSASVPQTGGGLTGAVDFLQQIYANGGKEYFDAVAAHPYSYPLFPNDPQNFNGWQIMEDGLRAAMVDNGDSWKKIWVTEFGAPTAGGGNQVSEADQAVFLQQAYDLASTSGYTGPVLWYSYKDRGVDAGSTEDWFGLIRPNGTQKPAYNVFKTIGASDNPATTLPSVGGALPYSPRGSYTKTVDLNVDDIRTYNSSTYSGQHVRVIPKNSIDTARALVFWNCASVTIIGGHFRPSAKNWGYNAESGTGSKGPATLNFNNCGAVYLEGVVVDNTNLIVTDPASGENGGDAVFISGKNADTEVTVQNCAWINVRGVQTLSGVAAGDEGKAHGDIFQTASTTQGRTGPVRFYNFTGSGDYQGFFMDPQARPSGVTDYPDGGIASVSLSRVNLKRTRQDTQKFRLIFLFSSASAYDNRGYPVNFDNVWVDGLPGDGLEQTIWPTNTAGSANFALKYRATIGTDTIGRYAEYQGLTNAGKVVSGRIYQGSPATGDFCPVSAIGVGYIQGTVIGGTAPVAPTVRSLLPATFTATTTTSFVEFQRTLTGTSILTAIAITERPHEEWVGEGTGNLTQNSATAVTVNVLTTMSARRSFATTAGQTYAVSLTIGAQNAVVSVGNNPAGVNIVAGQSAPIGANVVTFIANSSISHVKVTSTTTGLMLVSGISLDESIWAIGGPGTVSNLTETTATITGAGGTPTFARRVFSTVPGSRYTVSWTSDSTTGTWSVGSAEGLTDIVAPGPSYVLGANTSIFTATTSLTYVQFQRTAAGVVNLSGVAFAFSPTIAWAGGGAGTTSIPNDSQVTLNPVGTAATYARRTFDTSPSRKYTFNVAVATNAAVLRLGTTAGGGELAPSLALPIGPTTGLEFVSDTTPTHVELSRTAAGASTLTGLTLTELSTHAWYSGGPGAVSISDNNTFSLAGTGTTTTFVHRPIPTIAGREYLWTFNVSGGTPQRQVGSVFSGSDLASLATCTTGVNSVRFPATSHQAWLRVQQTASSSTISISGNNFVLLPFELATAWTISGTGTTTVDGSQTVTINGTGSTATAARRSYNTIVGKAYELLFNVTGQPCAYYVGSSDGGSQIVAQTTGNPGTVSVKFTAPSATTFLSVQRTGTGATVVTRPVMSPTIITNTVSATIASFNDTNLGGIGKPYWYVDRLSDSATDGSGNRGSLRYCLTNSIGDNRLILSEIQGIITRTADLNISPGRNNVTIAGYTGPGPLVLQGSWNFGIRGQNNVIEHLAFEREYNDRGTSNGDGMQIVSTGPRDVNHIMVRNCFTAHSQDEAFQIFRSRSNNGENQSDISLHWNVFTNALKDPSEYNSAFKPNDNVLPANGFDGDHNFNVLIGGYIFNVDVQRNIFANGKQRNPRFSAPNTNNLVANNVIINWGYGGIGFQSEIDDFQQTNNPAGSLRYKMSVIGNIGIPGPDTTKIELISQHGSGRLGGDSLIHISDNSIVQGLNAALTATANTIGYENAARAHYPQFPGIQSARQDTLTAVQAIAQAVLLSEMNLNAGPFPKLRAQNPNLLRGVTQALGQMNREIAGKHINHEDEGPGLSVVPTISRPLTGDLAPPSDPTNVAQVQAWLRERRLEVAYD